ncbi:hypothetical protein EBZ39_14605 [bacterium]|nr:hypothetical protein [bacterium]
MLGNKDSIIYLAVADGKIVRRVKEPTANSRQRTTKEGKTVHEELYDYATGLITDITTRENDFGKFWNVVMTDGSNTYVLQFKYSGGNATSFLKSIPNADVTKRITIMPKMQTVGDKKRASLVLIQDNQAIRWKWTKDNPGDVPQLRKIKVKGIEQWDDSDMMDYLERYLMQHVKTKLAKSANIGAADATEAEDDEPTF